MSAATRAELSKMKSALVKANRRRAALEDAVAKLTRENDTLRLTPLLATAGGAGGAAATRRVLSTRLDEDGLDAERDPEGTSALAPPSLLQMLAQVGGIAANALATAEAEE